MPKVNTLFNYFSSPKGVTPQSKITTKEESSPASKTSKAKSETHKSEQKNKGKENIKQNKEKKRPLDDVDENDVDEEKEHIIRKPTKKRRIIIPDDNSDDSEDEYKPDAEEEDDTSLSEAASESEPPTETDEDESPKKKQKLNICKFRGKSISAKKGNINKSTIKNLNSNKQISGKASDTQSWPHLTYDFLQPDKIKDNNRRSVDHPDYDPKTVYVPQEFLNNLTPAMRQWWILKSDHYDVVLFFKVGKFYELYHMDAVIGVNELNLSYMRGEFAHSGFPEIAYGRFSASLIERGYKVARIEQTENPEMMAQRVQKMSKPSKYDKVVKREICQISTKGTRVYTSQDAEASAPTSTYLLSIVEKHTSGQNTSTYGVCFVDTTIGDFNLGQFQDDKCSSRLLTLLAHYPPAHIIYERGNLTPNTIKILNSYCHGVMKDALQKETQFWSSSKVLKYLHEGEYFKQDSKFSWPKGLAPYLNKGDSLGLTSDEEKELSVTALGGCVYLLKEYQLDQQLLAQGRFKTYTPPDFTEKSTSKTKFAYNMVLDAITIYNLRVIGNDHSLFATLDHCCTAFGKRLLREWVCRPACCKNIINERQEAILILLNNPDVSQEVSNKLSNLPDLERLLSKIHAQGNAAKLRNHPDGRAILFDKDVYSKRIISDFITTLNGIEELLKIVELFADFKNPLINKCTKLEPEGDFPDLQETLDHFKNAFDHEEAKKEGFIVPKHGVDKDYDAVLIEFEEIKKELNAYLDKQRKYFGVMVKYVGTDKKRYQIEIPDTQMKKVGRGYELQGSRKGFKRYTTAETKELLGRQIEAEEQKDRVLKDSNRKIFEKFSQHYEKWSNAVYNIAIIDCLISLAKYARTCDTCIPHIYDDTDNEGIFIEIKEGKHPCIVSENFIPNDSLVATGGAAPLIILTGPNMGGKSTLMRQVGLITIMAQIGCHVPASACRLTLVDRIFTRLGASDDIMAGQSTFLVELSETAAILQHATKFSLVLLDELGRGTSTYDGTAIAASVVEALTKINCRTLFSTHYHSLVEDYKTNNNVTLAHMACMVENENQDEACEENVTFLYKLSEGACPKSYGFNAARLAGIPVDITKRARDIATKLEAEVNLRHTFTALCKLEDDSFKVLLEKTRTLLLMI
ncbi:probable DNA mismatch repair protein Msh6 [Phymastichus coffea]|uniref:probable DNA mismatch repair protein Msh6 n=1 Tax=Phymastichus coffea TaxID=108790 RepID=UPI00273B6D59|nr:probable DNA mismatch repair protein Msh6 [Phymastichus coffea]